MKTMPHDHADTHFCLQHTATLPFVEQALSLPASLRARVQCGSDAVPTLWRLDWAQLAANDRAFLESGEYLPALAFCWLQQAAALLRFCRQHGHSAALWVLPGGQLTELAISDLMQVMGSDAWLDDAQIALLWGRAASSPHARTVAPTAALPGRALSQWRWPQHGLVGTAEGQGAAGRAGDVG